MATLKDISVRLKSIKNIQKITASMKMVSAAKFAKAERDLRPAKAYGNGAKAFYQCAEIGEADKPLSGHLIIAVTSDRGLCGAAHSSVVKAIRECVRATPEVETTRLVLIGDKSRGMLVRQYGANVLFTFSEVGRKPPTFEDASFIAQSIMSSDFKFDKASLYFNVFKSVVSYSTTAQPLYGIDTISRSQKLSIYDEIDEEALRCYNEFLLTSFIYYALKEASCSEQSARMTAMDSATKNADEMTQKLTLAFNRTRQAAITKELTEIISGAAAV
ncbi:unnamed protein product [Protopolystoma xenopodis]|uniref:ATP synthase subunit gamma n=1 Tax=Protopolystoma xenopodis TaxID=117903 RepID=A0A3S5BZT3_9PLAT|nr:unnamed protein product [Protopolystoma xenopodis]